MKALQIDRFGGPEVLRYREVADPVPGWGEVLVRTGAAGVNFGEIILREGGAVVDVALPLILGSEAAGTVERLGSGVTNVSVGDRVAVPLFVTGRLDGGYAELIVAPGSILVPLPASMSFEQAVALQMQGLTALAMLDRTAPAGKTILVHAAAGGVGSHLVQLARIRGARRVIATAGSRAKLDAARQFGADVAIDYREPDWVDHVLDATDKRGADLVYDPVGGEIRTASLTALADEGTLVIYGIAATGRFEPVADLELAHMYMKCQAILAFSLWPVIRSGDVLRRGLDELFALGTAGDLTTVIGQRHPLAEGARAHRALRAREVIGKVVLIP